MPPKTSTNRALNQPTRRRPVAAGVAAAAVGMTLALLSPTTATADSSHGSSQNTGSSQKSGRPDPKTGIPLSKQSELPPQYRGFEVKLAQFNILSGSIRGGGPQRAARAAHAIQGTGANVATFQEVDAQQLWSLMRTLPRFDFFPRRTLGTRGSAVQIAWSTKSFKLMNRGHIMVPVRGWMRPTPWVRLQERTTGRKFFVVTTHNAPHGRESERDAATARQIVLIKKLLRREDPIFVQGDVNERSEFCDKVAKATPLISANGGKQRFPCPVPRFGGPDWMMGYGADFSGFAKVYNGISDHPMLKVTADIAPLPLPADLKDPASGKKSGNKSDKQTQR